jgi:hypothetical protein
MRESSTAANKKVLIVGDHPMFRAMLARLINQEPDMEVCGASPFHPPSGPAQRLFQGLPPKANY